MKDEGRMKGGKRRNRGVLPNTEVIGSKGSEGKKGIKRKNLARNTAPSRSWGALEREVVFWGNRGPA